MKKNTVIAFAVGAAIGGVAALTELARELTVAPNARANRDFLHTTFNEWEEDEDKRWTAPEQSGAIPFLIFSAPLMEP